MSVLLRAPVDRPGVRAVLAELSLMGVDPRVVHTGRGDLPSKMIMSQPANFISAPKKPPEFEQAMALVNAPLVTTV